MCLGFFGDLPPFSLSSKFVVCAAFEFIRISLFFFHCWHVEISTTGCGDNIYSRFFSAFANRAIYVIFSRWQFCCRKTMGFFIFMISMRLSAKLIRKTKPAKTVGWMRFSLKANWITTRFSFSRKTKRLHWSRTKVKSPGRRKIYFAFFVYQSTQSVRLTSTASQSQHAFHCEWAVWQDANYKFPFVGEIRHRSSFSIIILINNLNWKLSHKNLVINYAQCIKNTPPPK